MSGCEAAVCPHTREGWWHTRLHQLEYSCPAEGFGSFCSPVVSAWSSAVLPWAPWGMSGLWTHWEAVEMGGKPGAHGVGGKTESYACSDWNLWGLETLMLFHHLNGRLHREQRQTVPNVLLLLMEIQWTQVAAQEVPISWEEQIFHPPWMCQMLEQGPREVVEFTFLEVLTTWLDKP